MPGKIVASVFAACLSILTLPASALDLNAFGDITYGNSSKNGENPGFSLGQLDLWGTHIIDEDRKMKAFMEVVIESSDDGFVVDLERLWIDYALKPNIHVRGGRFHSSLGHWNRKYHHGSQVQTTVFRPLFLDFEDGSTAILPTHIVGLMGVANFDMEQGTLHMEVQVGNGSYFNGSELDPNNGGDVDSGKAIVGRAVFKPDMLEGLAMGVSLFNNPVSQLSGGAIVDLVDQQIYDIDIVYDENDYEILFEHYWIKNKDTVGTSRTSTAWYAQLGYAFTQSMMPYFRYENMKDVDANDPYFLALATSQYSQSLVGVRYDLNDSSSLKLEGRSLSEPGESSNSFWLQWTFAF